MTDDRKRAEEWLKHVGMPYVAPDVDRLAFVFESVRREAYEEAATVADNWELGRRIAFEIRKLADAGGGQGNDE